MGAYQDLAAYPLGLTVARSLAGAASDEPGLQQRGGAHNPPRGIQRE